MAHNGKHALITGSSRGIGRGIALKLAERGVRVAINYRKNEAAAKDTLAKVRQAGSDGFTVQADVCRADRKSTRLNSSHLGISYAVFCLKKKTMNNKLTVLNHPCKKRIRDRQ